MPSWAGRGNRDVFCLYRRSISSERRGVKGYVILAALLLVPTMASFQKFRFEGDLQGRLVAEVLEKLETGGVEGAEVRLDWLDVTIDGMVSDEEVRDRMAERVAEHPGVRLAAGGNGLKVRGWLRVARQGGEWTVEGLLPRRFEVLGRTGGEQNPQAGWRRAEWVQAPVDERECDEFLGKYFDVPGDRDAEWRDGRLRLTGEATQDLRAEWLALAAKVVPENLVTDEFTVHASIRHFAGYVPEGMEDLEGLRKLREKLEAATVTFAPRSAEVPTAEGGKVAAAAAVILEQGEGMVFVVEGSPGATEDGEEALGLWRAREIGKLLVEYGVSESQLEFLAVDAGGEEAHRAAIFVK